MSEREKKMNEICWHDRKQCNKDGQMLSPCIEHRSPDAEDSTAASQISHYFTLNVIKRVLNRIKHACWGKTGS